MSTQTPAIRVMMMPRDTNGHGTIFGGIILSYIDQAGAVGAIEGGCRQVVTVAMNKVEFHAPVFVGDLVSLYSEVQNSGRTSMVVHVMVKARRQRDPSEEITVTEATVTYVNVDGEGRPVPIES